MPELISSIGFVFTFKYKVTPFRGENVDFCFHEIENFGLMFLLFIFRVTAPVGVFHLGISFGLSYYKTVEVSFKGISFL